ncbi:MAG: arylmalonate decarboxylase, partial [Myxococcota bacterium]
RKKFAVIAPSTNTIVEPDYYRMTVPGVTAHISRIHIRDQNLSSDSAFEELLVQIREETRHAVTRIVTCQPDYMVMGMSAETFWGGVAGNRAFKQRITEQSGLDVATGAEACERALTLYKAKRIAVITPYQPIADAQVISFFSELGVEVIAHKGLRCPSAVAIAQVSEATLRDTLRELDSDRVDAIVQVGTNLSMVGLADEAERWLGKPVIAINAATWWLALRANGIDDRIHGCGSLLRDH